MAALVLGGLVAAACAPAAKAAVTVFVGSNNTGTVNKYVDGTLVGQIAAQGSTPNDFTRGVELGPDGMLYVDRLSGSTVQAYNPGTLTPTGSPFTINSNGGQSFGTYSLSFGPDKTSLYVAVMSDDSVQKINTTTGISQNLVPFQSGGLRVPMDTLVVGNTLYVSAFNTGSGNNGSVLRYDATTGAFEGTFITPGQDGLLGPVGLAQGADGNILVSGFSSSNILKFTPTGTFIGTFIAPGTGGLQNPTDMQIDADNGDLYIASSTDNSVRAFDGTTGAYIGFAVAPGAGGLAGATYLAVTGSDAGSGVPLPSGAWAGLVTLGLLGGAYGVQQRRRAVV